MVLIKSMSNHEKPVRICRMSQELTWLKTVKYRQEAREKPRIREMSAEIGDNGKEVAEQAQITLVSLDRQEHREEEMWIVRGESVMTNRQAVVVINLMVMKMAGVESRPARRRFATRGRNYHFSQINRELIADRRSCGDRQMRWRLEPMVDNGTRWLCPAPAAKGGKATLPHFVFLLLFQPLCGSRKLEVAAPLPFPHLL